MKKILKEIWHFPKPTASYKDNRLHAILRRLGEYSIEAALKTSSLFSDHYGISVPVRRSNQAIRIISENFSRSS